MNIRRLLSVLSAITLVFTCINSVFSLSIKSLIPTETFKGLGNMVSEGVDKAGNVISKAVSIPVEGIDKAGNLISGALSKKNNSLNCLGLRIGFVINIVERAFKQTQAEDVRFYFYSRDQPVRVRVHVKDDFNLDAIHFRIDRKTIIICHGFMSNGQEQWVTDMKDAFLKLVSQIIV